MGVIHIIFSIISIGINAFYVLLIGCIVYLWGYLTCYDILGNKLPKSMIETCKKHKCIPYIMFLFWMVIAVLNICPSPLLFFLITMDLIFRDNIYNED